MQIVRFNLLIFIERAIVFNRFTTIYKNNKLITDKMQDDEGAIHSKENITNIPSFKQLRYHY